VEHPCHLARQETFFTLGYQQHTLPSMLRVLTSNHIEVVVDVRQNPLSRKAGFSKNRLERSLRRVGIEYLHFPGLGTPLRIRAWYFRNGKVNIALKQYERYLQSKDTCLRSLIQRVRSKQFCLLCLERDHNFCHRDVIARKLAEMTECQPIHLV
jgi:uncharacterized protein (DUF488 family)